MRDVDFLDAATLGLTDGGARASARPAPSGVRGGGRGRRRASSSRSSGPRGSGSPVWSKSSSPASGTGRRVLRGRCLPYGEGITYYPVVEAIKQAAGLADFDLPDVVEARVCAILEGDEHQATVCRHVAQLMGVAEATAGEETFWAIRRFFEASARERPLVLVFDDVHWGEPTFLDLVEHIADWSRGSPILLLCMARSDLLEVAARLGRREVERRDRVAGAAHRGTGLDPRDEPPGLYRPADRARRGDRREGRGQPAVRRGDARDVDR